MELSYIDAYYYLLLLNAGYEKEVTTWINSIAETSKTLEGIYLDLVCGLGDNNELISILHNYICEKEIDDEVLCTKLRLFIKNKVDNRELNIEGIATLCHIFVSTIDRMHKKCWNDFYIIDVYYEAVEDNIIYLERYSMLVLNYLETGESLDSNDFWEKRSNFFTKMKKDKITLSPIRFKNNYIYTPIICLIMIILITIITILISIDETKYLIPSLMLFIVFWGLFILIFILLLITRRKEIKYEIDKYNFEINNDKDTYFIASKDGVIFNFSKDGIITNNKKISYDEFIISLFISNYQNKINIYIEFVLINEELKYYPTWNFRLTNDLLNAIIKFNIPVINFEELMHIVKNKNTALREIYKTGIISKTYKNTNKIDIISAHEFSFNNKKLIEKSNTCGCFYCLHIFKKEDITIYFEDEETAICPNCEIDSIIPDASGFEITKEFLNKMHKYWFRRK